MREDLTLWENSDDITTSLERKSPWLLDTSHGPVQLVINQSLKKTASTMANIAQLTRIDSNTLERKSSWRTCDKSVFGSTIIRFGGITWRELMLLVTQILQKTVQRLCIKIWKLTGKVLWNALTNPLLRQKTTISYLKRTLLNGSWEDLTLSLLLLLTTLLTEEH